MTRPGVEFPPVTSIEDVNGRLLRVDELEAELSQVLERRQRAIAAIDETSERAKKRIEDELDSHRAAIKKFILSRRASLIRRLGRTIQLDNGIIKIHKIRASLHTPKNTEQIIQHLLDMRGGKRYLRVSYTLDRLALAKAGKDLLRHLRPLGVWVGREEQVTIQTEHMAKAATLHTRPYPHRAV